MKYMYYSQDIVEKVVSSTDIVDVVGQYVHLRRSGANYFGLCPFHTEKSGSFSVSPSKQIFYCFGCGEGGDVVTFLQKYENYSFQEALKVLADRAGITLPEVSYSEQAGARARKKEVLLAINRDAATYYYRLLRLPAGKAGMDYFTGRGLSKETMTAFGLGYASGAGSDLTAYLRKKGYSDEDIMDAGVASFDEKRGIYDKFFNRVMFPIMDVTNKVIGFGGRVLGDGKPKYLNSPETLIFDKGRNLYGLSIAKKARSDYFILCEGYMDVIAMHQAGFSMALASLGTSFTEGQAAVVHRYVKLVLLAYDSDLAGVRAALRNIGILRTAGIISRVIDMRPYKDPDEFIKTLGREAFQERIDQAENSFFFELRQMEANYQMDDPASRTEFYHAIAKRLCVFDDEIERDNYIKAVADKYYIPENSLRREVASYDLISDGADRNRSRTLTGPAVVERQTDASGRYRNQSQDASVIYTNNAGITSGAAQASADRPRKADPAVAAFRKNQRLLLTWISDEPAIYPKVRRYISADDFEEGICRQAASFYFSRLDSELADALSEAAGTMDSQTVKTTPASVVRMFDTEEEQREAAALFETHILGITDEKEKAQALKDVILSMKKYGLEKMMADMASDPSMLKKATAAKKKIEQIQAADFAAEWHYGNQTEQTA